jgi:hypothetical protein
MRLSELSAARKALVRAMQALNYGSLLDLKISNGEICMDTEVDALMDIRLDGEPSPRLELQLEDFALSRETCQLFTEIDALRDGSIERIVVHAGIPRRVTLRTLLSTTTSFRK